MHSDHSGGADHAGHDRHHHHYNHYNRPQTFSSTVTYASPSPSAYQPSVVPGTRYRAGSRTSSYSRRSSNNRIKPYIIKPIQKRLPNTDRFRSASPLTSSGAVGRLRPSTPGSANPYVDQMLMQDRPSNATPSSSGHVHTPMASFEASFDGIASLGFDLDAFGSNERLMASSTASFSSSSLPQSVTLSP